MEIIRVTKDRNYTIINNMVVKDKRLSLKAKGLFLTVIALPPNWDFSINGLTEILKEGKKAVYSAIKELIKYGYCERMYNYDVREGKVVRTHASYVFYEASKHERSDLNSQKVDLQKVDLQKAPQLSTYNNKILKRENTPESLTVRKQVFKDKIKSTSYSEDMKFAFFNYWTELDNSQTRMKFESEKFFEVEKRLSSWATKEKVFNPPKDRL